MTTVVEAPVPTSNYDEYRQVLREACEQSPEEWSFKSDMRYMRVLECVTQNQGIRFIEQIQLEYPKHWATILEMLPDLVNTNDRYGKPAGQFFHLLGFSCSPSNFRYLSQALRLWTYATSCVLKAMHVVELGGGYGGLAFYVYRLAHLFPVRLDRYTMIDLPESAEIAARISSMLDVPLHAVDGLDEQAIERALEASDAPRMFFSAYAFSEFDGDTRGWYEHRVARKCSHGIVLWNFLNREVDLAEKPLGGPVYQFVDQPLRIERDRPAMYPEGIRLVTY